MREEVLKYFNGEGLPTDVFINKYSKNKSETPEEMHKRLAKDFARIDTNYFHAKDFKEEEWENLSTYGKLRMKEQENCYDTDWEGRIYNLFKHFEFIIPGGSVMQGLGSGKPVSLSNCFVLQSPDDSIESIWNTARDAAQIYKRRGGVGLDISNLRPAGAEVNNAAKTSTGAISFMHLYDITTKIIGQEGRRGALMLSIDVNHPDVFEFVNIKKDLTKITSANISVRPNDNFLKAVRNNEDYILRYPCNYTFSPLMDFEDKEYNKLYSIEDWKVKVYYKKIKAIELWDNIITNAHLTAEPGIFNWEKLVNYDPTGVYIELKPISTNPCGELGLSGYDSCRLIATNLYSLVDNPFTKEATIDYYRAYEIFYEAQVLADSLVDLELEAVDRILTKIDFSWREELNLCGSYKDKYDEFEENYLQYYSDEFKLWWKIKRIGSKGRRTGTGITAYADMLAALGAEYGDTAITDRIFKIKLQAELDASIDMAIIRGAFPLYDSNKEFYKHYDSDNELSIISGKNDWYQMLSEIYPEQAFRMCKYGRRNAGLSTVAPTGSVSILTQTSSGIEPVFLPLYTRKVTCHSGETPDIIEQGIGYKEVPIVHPKLKTWYELTGHGILEQYVGESLDKIPTVEELTKNDWEYLYQFSPYYQQDSASIDYNTRIETQALIQKYITSSISSTVNLPKETPKEVVGDLYLKAFDLGCKGITVYREGSRKGILVSDTSNEESFKQHEAPKRGRELAANLHITRSRGNIYAVIVGLKEGKPYEVFVFNTLGTNLKECSGKIIKVKKRHYKFESDEITIDNIDENSNTELERACALYTSMLLRHGTPIHYVIKTAKKINDSITSFVSAMCRILNKYDDIKEVLECPKCGGRLIKESGCDKCLDCGESKCN